MTNSADTCYVIIPEDKVTSRMVNLSLSKKLDNVPILAGYAILETYTPAPDVFLDYPLLSKEEVHEWQADTLLEIEGSILMKIKRFLGLVPLF